MGKDLKLWFILPGLHANLKYQLLILKIFPFLRLVKKILDLEELLPKVKSLIRGLEKEHILVSCYGEDIGTFVTKKYKFCPILS